MAIYNVGVGGSTAMQPTPEKIPNDPAGAPNAGASPFQAPAGWAAWGKPQPTPAPVALGSGPGGPATASVGMGTSNPTSPLAQTLLGQASGLPVDPAKFGPHTQRAIASNAQFAQQYQAGQDAQRSRLVDALGGIASLATWQNPFSGMGQSANLTGG